MNETEPASDLADTVGRQLPYLRRYARALTGRQETGDTYAAATLEALLGDRGTLANASSPRVALFRAFHAIWASIGGPVELPDNKLEQRAQRHLAHLTPNTREALLLHTIEEFRFSEIAEVMQIGQDEAEDLVRIALEEMGRKIVGRALIIEDEAIISMDLQSIVTGMGHLVTGVARTEAEAVRLGSDTPPHLILADIQLADNSSGIDAVNRLMTDVGEVPTIFITAFPERLLTGNKREPAFLISKPYSEEQVRSAVSQAMFFASTETLGV